jgi:hypothetical protein
MCRFFHSKQEWEPSMHQILLLVVFLSLSISTTLTAFFLIPKPEKSPAQPYAVVIRQSTYRNPGWRKVAKRLSEKHQGMVFTYERDHDEVLDNLHKFQPRYIAFVMPADEASRDTVTHIHQMTRKIDQDPYGDAIWGIVTAYAPEQALAMASVPRLEVRQGLGKTQMRWLTQLQLGAYYSEAVKNHKYVKQPGKAAQRVRGPDDTTREIVNALNSGQVDIMWTSGHASERDWQMGWAFPDGVFYSDAGFLKARDTNGRVYEINCGRPLIYYGPGNCLIGHINNPRNSMALSWIRAGACQFAGYTRESWYGYMGWGVGDYFFDHPGRFTFAESVFLNNQSLLFDLNNQIPGINPEGHGYDRDAFVLYGDPALDARIVNFSQPPLYHQQLKYQKVGTGQYLVEFTVCMQKTVEINRPAAVFLPFHLSSYSRLDSNSFKVTITDDFVLMMLNAPSNRELQQGEERFARFIAEGEAKIDDPGRLPHGNSKPDLPYEFNFEKGLKDWRLSSTAPEEIMPEWKDNYQGRSGVVILNSCSYPARDRRLGGATTTSISRQVWLPPEAETIRLQIAKCPGGGQHSGYCDGFLALYLDGHLVKQWYLRAAAGKPIEWRQVEVNISDYAGPSRKLDLISRPGGSGKNCSSCTGRCDHEAVAVSGLTIVQSLKR